MKKHTLFLLLFLCTVLTACKSEAPQEPVKAEPCPISAVPLDYVPAGHGEGTTDLICNEHWEVYIEEREPEQPGNSAPVVWTLVCRDRSTGDAQVLDQLSYGFETGFWDGVRLYPFAGILGCDGFLFSYQNGSAYQAFDFYSVSEDTLPVRIARCYNTLYTADLDNDGCLELLTNYHIPGYAGLFWSEDGTVRSCSLNRTALDFLELSDKVDWVSLMIDPETGKLTADWTSYGSRETRQLDAAALLAYEKNHSATTVLE